MRGRLSLHVKKNLKWLLPAAAAAGLAAFLAAGLDNELTVRRYTVESGKVTAPVRLAVLSDLHACDYGAGQGELLDAVAEQDPDLVLLAGDIVDDRPEMPEARDFRNSHKIPRRRFSPRQTVLTISGL